MAVLKEESQLAVMGERIANIQNDVAEIKTDIKAQAQAFATIKYVDDQISGLKGDISPLRRIIFGAVGLLLVAFGTAVINFFVKQQP